MSNSLPDILNRWLRHERYTVHEMADAMDCSTKTVYAYAGGDRNIPYRRARRLARYTYDARGDTAIQEHLAGPQLEVSPRGPGSADGVIDDEATDMTSLMGKIIDAHREGNREKLAQLVSDGDEVWNRIIAEKDRLPG